MAAYDVAIIKEQIVGIQRVIKLGVTSPMCGLVPFVQGTAMAGKGFT